MLRSTTFALALMGTTTFPATALAKPGIELGLRTGGGYAAGLSQPFAYAGPSAAVSVALRLDGAAHHAVGVVARYDALFFVDNGHRDQGYQVALNYDYRIGAAGSLRGLIGGSLGTGGWSACFSRSDVCNAQGVTLGAHGGALIPLAKRLDLSMTGEFMLGPGMGDFVLVYPSLWVGVQVGF